MLEQQLINTLSPECTCASFAPGSTLVFGILGVINLSHDAVFMLGACAALQVVFHFKLPLWATSATGSVVSGVAGPITDVLLLRPLRRRNVPRLVPMTATIGAGITINNAMQGMFGAENLRFPAGLVSSASLDPGGIHLTPLELNIIALSFALMAALMLLLKRTQFGRTLRAIAESPKVTALLGINIGGLFLLTSFTAAALSELSDVLIGLYSNAVFPLMGQPILHKGIAVIILGGLDDVRDVILGGLFLGSTEVLSVAYIGSTMHDTVTFGLLFLILLVRPQGLFGKVLERRA